MANESLVNIELPRIVVNRICAEATAIPYGSLMELETSPNTVAISNGNGNVFGGITVEEFKGGEGLTHVSCGMDGVWDTPTAGAITLGALCNISGLNTVDAAEAADLLTGTVCCKCEETAGGAAIKRMRFIGY